ncbi:MAG: hypothetical protein N2506_06545 [Dehalococcoidales bacterium]|nr:hypothetical protein [Dehalococcoidales bacterium]
MIGLWKRLKQNERGITGLETAIILIAFVIVASVFAYVVLSAGVFSSQKVKEAVSTGVQSTTATLEIRGNIIARMDESTVKEVFFCIGIPPGGGAVDFTPSGAAGDNRTHLIIISYSDPNVYIPSLNWTVERLSWGNDDYLLDPNELFLLHVYMPETANITVGPYDTFSLEIKPPEGAVLTVERTIPARVTEYVNLH